MKTKITTVVLVLLFIGYMAIGGTNEPGRSMGAALSGIQDAILSLIEEPVVIEKDWYHGRFKVNPSHNDALFTVPADRQFVLLRFYAYPYKPNSTSWRLTADETTLLDGSIIRYSYRTNQGGTTYKYEHDFPDRCVTVNAGETLNAVNEDALPLEVTIIGYFRDSD